MHFTICVEITYKNEDKNFKKEENVSSDSQPDDLGSKSNAAPQSYADVVKSKFSAAQGRSSNIEKQWQDK